MHIQDLVAKYNQPAPRYTSYPTALQFHDKVGEVEGRTWLGQVDDTAPVSLYVHIPYCHSLCHYCGCHTKIVAKQKPIEAYIDNVCQEIDLAASHMTRKPAVGHLHFGGGSPNYAPLEALEKLINKLRAHFTFTPQSRIDMEVDPRLLTAEQIQGLVKLGVSRVSLGVQDFNPDVQQAVNRIQTFEHVAKQVETFRQHGLNHINFDLMVGLPKQTVESVRQTARQALSLQPSRFAVFAYAHVPWMKKHQLLLEKYTMAEGYERFLMQQAVAKEITQAGYHSIGIDHFAQATDPLYIAQEKGRLRRNFQGYTDDKAQTVISFGVSAISQFPQGFVQNVVDSRLYKEALNKAQLPVMRGYACQAGDTTSGQLIHQLMCYFEADLSQYKNTVPTQALATMEADGLLTQTGSKLRITEQGKPFVRLVAQLFDHHYQQQEQRHAKAI